MSQSIDVFVKLLYVFLAPFEIQTKRKQKILNHVEYRIDMQNAFHVACCRNRKWCILLNWTSQLNWPRSIPFDIHWNFQLLEFCSNFAIHIHVFIITMMPIQELTYEHSERKNIIKDTLRNVPIWYSERFVTFQNISKVWWSNLSSPREDNCW